MTSTCSSAVWSCRPGNDWPRPATWQPERPAPDSPSHSDPRTGPHPNGTADEHQREPKCQVLDRGIGDAASAEEHDASRTQDGMIAVSDDTAPGQPAVGEQLEDHDNAVRRPPGPCANQGRPQDEEVRGDGDQCGDGGGCGVGDHPAWPVMARGAGNTRRSRPRTSGLRPVGSPQRTRTPPVAV